MSKRRSELRVTDAALLFAALGDETRLRLLQQLSRIGPASISVLSEKFPVSRQAITKHLRSLSAARLIEGRRAGREHRWALNAGRLAEARRCLEIVGRGWDEALSRLKKHLEDG
jgi:DNA-binding transcriptional ArsR family regulator